MQHQANPSRELIFATIVPSVTSTRHVAAAAFYHCLGKNIPFGRRKDIAAEFSVSMF